MNALSSLYQSFTGSIQSLVESGGLVMSRCLQWLPGSVLREKSVIGPAKESGVSIYKRALTAASERFEGNQATDRDGINLSEVQQGCIKLFLENLRSDPLVDNFSSLLTYLGDVNKEQEKEVIKCLILQAGSNSGPTVRLDLYVKDVFLSQSAKDFFEENCRHRVEIMQFLIENIAKGKIKYEKLEWIVWTMLSDYYLPLKEGSIPQVGQEESLRIIAFCVCAIKHLLSFPLINKVGGTIARANAEGLLKLYASFIRYDELSWRNEQKLTFESEPGLYLEFIKSCIGFLVNPGSDNEKIYETIRLKFHFIQLYALNFKEKLIVLGCLFPFLFNKETIGKILSSFLETLIIGVIFDNIVVKTIFESIPVFLFITLPRFIFKYMQAIARGVASVVYYAVLIALVCVYMSLLTWVVFFLILG